MLNLLFQNVEYNNSIFTQLFLAKKKVNISTLSYTDKKERKNSNHADVIVATTYRSIHHQRSIGTVPALAVHSVRAFSLCGRESESQHAGLFLCFHGPV